jgi:protein phosphatase
MNPEPKGSSADFHGAETLEMPLLQDPKAGAPPASDSAHIRAEVAGATHCGLLRTVNEDHYLLVRFGRTLEVIGSNVPEDLAPRHTEETGYCMVVADGVGGTVAGAVASRLAVSKLVSLLLHTPDWLLRVGDHELAIVKRRMAQRYRDVDTTLAQAAHDNTALTGMATTMTLACTLGKDMIVAHLGDSRAYLHRGGQLARLTHDHTVAQGMSDDGLIGQQDVARHELRHVLTQVIGYGALIEPEVHRFQVAGGDQVLLCTDGLTEMVDESAIETILDGPGTVGECCQALIDRALQQGGKDNVTVVLARFVCCNG